MTTLTTESAMWFKVSVGNWKMKRGRLMSNEHKAHWILDDNCGWWWFDEHWHRFNPWSIVVISLIIIGNFNVLTLIKCRKVIPMTVSSAAKYIGAISVWWSLLPFTKNLRFTILDTEYSRRPEPYQFGAQYCYYCST